MRTRTSQGALFVALFCSTLHARNPAEEPALGARDVPGENALPSGCAAEAILTAGATLDGLDHFGKSVAVFGDTALIGAPHDAGNTDAGAVYVFVRSGTTWTEEQRLIPSDTEAGDRFGMSVDLWGDTAVVGAQLKDQGGTLDGGAAYVFVRSGGVWSEQQKLTATNPMDDDQFGFSVAIWEDTIVVGAIRDDSPITDAGSAFVFVRQGTSWSQEQRLTASDPFNGDRFGVSVDVEFEQAVVGAFRDDHGFGFADAGSAYVFVRSGTSWTQQQKLVASDAEANDGFGRSVAISGETALVGAPDDDLANELDAGSAYVWVRSGELWSEQQKLAWSDADEGDHFGASVCLAGDTAVVGAPSDDWANPVDVGAAYVFGRSGATWSEQRKLFPVDGLFGDDFGLSTSLSGDTIAVGVPHDDHSNETDAGSVQVFRLCPAVTPYCTAGFSASGCQATLSASGSPSLTAASGFTLMAANVEGAMGGAFFFGTNGQQSNPWGNGTSFLCVVPPVTRTGMLDGSGTVGACDGSFALDLNALWCPSCAYSSKAPAPGVQVQAQLWYRDPANTSNQKTSLSNAVLICAAP